jgi:hypothetical protein
VASKGLSEKRVSKSEKERNGTAENKELREISIVEERGLLVRVANAGLSEDLRAGKRR